MSCFFTSLFVSCKESVKAAKNEAKEWSPTIIRPAERERVFQSLNSHGSQSRDRKLSLFVFVCVFVRVRVFPFSLRAAHSRNFGLCSSLQPWGHWCVFYTESMLGNGNRFEPGPMDTKERGQVLLEFHRWLLSRALRFQMCVEKRLPRCTCVSVCVHVYRHLFKCVCSHR